MDFKRHEVIEMEGQSFECSINGNLINQKKSKLMRGLNRFKEDLSQNKCGQMKVPLTRMTNGEIISPEKYPWIVPLSIEGDKLCGGTILGDHWILTSAHCVAKAHWAKVYFGVREYGFYEETQISQEFIIHPEYDFPHHDLALIKLPKRIVYTPFVQPVCLPTKESLDKNYKGFGWSTISDDETGASRYLRGTILKEIEVEDCRNKYRNPQISHNIICIQSPNTCLEEQNEDSETDFSVSILGQIYENRFIIYGIASFSSNTCNESYPIGFTRLFPHTKWIMKQLNHPTTSVQLLPTFDVLDHGF
uniref:Serine protease 3 n=2 Tax=Lepeophtheirus salmonis TaxID=72036 RepID=C1BTG7_LEPSM|nr:Serine protease 3 precursor [Lepeophtheirus salmonis]